jgi:hypothetical protein
MSSEEEQALQIISDIEPVVDSSVNQMRLVAMLRDNQPIRTCCFSPSGDHFVLGTNSKSLKICRLPRSINGVEMEDEAVESGASYNKEGVEELQVVIEQ